MELQTKLFDPLAQALDQLNGAKIFGEPRQEGDVTLIPVAETSVMFGYGFGSGEGPEGAEQGTGSGGGGGLRGGAKPRGFIKVTPDGVHFEPAVNPTLISVAGIAMLMWSVFWIAVAVRALLGRKA
jgi:uncharacterized spore protein YtfJ